MAKVKRWGRANDMIAFMCPGCGHGHSINSTWTFNEDFDRPTFSPSVLVRHYEGQRISSVCHSFVREGRIEFLGDCTHVLAGQTVDLPDVD